VRFAKTYDDLKSRAVIFWPQDLADTEQAESVIPRLIETQDKFISVLHVADSSPTCWREVLAKTRGLPGNPFLKHLMVLADLGAEQLKRFRTELPKVFTNGLMEYVWNASTYTHEFRSFKPSHNWDNKSLGTDGAGLHNPAPLSDSMEDVAMLLLFGAGVTEPGVPGVVAERCVIGNLLGRKAELDVFVRQRYIWVSRITGGATANAMGHLAQKYVKERLQSLLLDWDFSKRSIPGISQNAGRTDIGFDMIAESPQGEFCAIKCSSQVTTNSTIERKAGQAQARQRLLHGFRHHIAYVIDGAGNFERRSALATICQYSDCTVTFRHDEIERLASFLQTLGSES
jgi:hypothetical protein